MRDKNPDGLPENPKYEYPIQGINWTSGIGRPAGIYWLAGESIIATHGSQAENHLVDLGAILMATLRFDSDPLERTHPGRPVRRVPAAHLMLFDSQ